jgi:aminopeptidase-like protein
MMPARDMGSPDAAALLEPADSLPFGQALELLCAALFPISRSITGDGVRETLALVEGYIPLAVHEVPSGTPVLDWVVPDEWSVTEAYVADATGHRVIDIRDSNLHLLGYSTPVHRRMSLNELHSHLFTLPQQPTLIPYRTSYYEPAWGFCLSHDHLNGLPDGDYEVVIDSRLEPGSLTYGECVIPGDETDEVLLTTHVCHPSLANDNVSGIAALCALGARLMARPQRRFTYRLLFIPGTIGSITWLARNEQRIHLIKHGLVLSGVGDRSALTYKRSRRGDAEIDRAAVHVLSARTQPHRLLRFEPYGYDERQFCSPGFNLPVGRLGRAAEGEYPEYHTSGDDLDFISADSVAETVAVVDELITTLEGNDRYINLAPKGEPQLGRRGLYRATGGQMDKKSVELAMLWTLNQSDGSVSLLEIADIAGLRFSEVRRAADALVAHDLLAPAPARSPHSKVADQSAGSLADE